jgi:hypothetical protein
MEATQNSTVVCAAFANRHSSLKGGPQVMEEVKTVIEGSMARW